MSFRVGQKVVCINDVFDTTVENFYEVFHKLPKKDKTYTIRASESGRVLLEEIINPESPFDIGGMTIWDEAGFADNRFIDLQQALRSLSEAKSSEFEAPQEIEKEKELLEVA